MKNKCKHRTIIKTLGVFQLLLFAFYWCGITFFTHSHVENGIVVVHSHPFKDLNHTHTPGQFKTIFFATTLPMLDEEPLLYTGQTFLLLLTVFLIPRVLHIPLKELEGVYQLRAPPF